MTNIDYDKIIEEYYDDFETKLYAYNIIGNVKHKLSERPDYIQFKTQKKILNSQTPKWVDYTMLVLVALTSILSVWALLQSYGLI